LVWNTWLFFFFFLRTKMCWIYGIVQWWEILLVCCMCELSMQELEISYIYIILLIRTPPRSVFDNSKEKKGHRKQKQSIRSKGVIDQAWLKETKIVVRVWSPSIFYSKWLTKTCEGKETKNKQILYILYM
jgi:hypothetical protein